MPVEDRGSLTEGLPGFYTNPAAYVSYPEERDPNDPTGGLQLADPTRAPTAYNDLQAYLEGLASSHLNLAAAPAHQSEQDLQLGEKHHKLKCPKCEHVQAASNNVCSKCGHNFKEARKAKFAKMNAGQPTGDVMLYQPDQGDLKLCVVHEGLVWKIACKTGTLALSPGPGQVDLEVPLVLDDELATPPSRSPESR